jgi:hypothetical protein
MSDQSDYRKQVEETQQESSTADNPESSGGKQEDEGEPALREGSQEAETGRPGVDDMFEQSIADAARLDKGIREEAEPAPGSSPESSSGAGEPATSSSDELPSGS